MTKFKHIIFDFDGTIANTSRIIIKTMQATMHEMGLDVVTHEAIKQVIGLPLTECFKYIYPGMSEQDALKCADSYCRIFDHNKSSLSPTLFPHVKDTLDSLNKHGITMNVASSRSHGSLIELLEMMSVRQYFNMVVGVDNVSHAKPHPEAVLKIIETFNINLSDALVVGDMPVDIAMGKNAGVKTCAVTYGNSSKHDLLKSHPDFLIDSLSQLLSCID